MADLTKRDAVGARQDYRANFKEIIAKRSDLTRYDGGRMVFAAPGALHTLLAGTVMGQVTAPGPTKGFWKAYDPNATDGSQNALGVLSEEATTNEFGDGSEVSVITSGVLYYDKLIGLDDAAVAGLRAKVFVEHGVNLIQF